MNKIFKKVFIKSALIGMTLFSAGPVLAAGDKVATIVQLTEKETSMEAYPVRYIISQKFLRIDDNNDKGDFVLYDDTKRIIYSVNHDDSTILVINFSQWTMPKFEFARNVSWKAIEDAPQIDGNSMFNYWLSAGSTVCSEAQVAKGFLMQEAKVLQRYKETLSAEQISSLVATPDDMRTDCMLVDQVYNMGSVFEKGFPVQQWHLNGLQRIVTGYKTKESVSAELFELPVDYKRYSIGDNLRFGEPGEPGSTQSLPASH